MYKKQALNPYLPSWEYIADGEPYVFGERVYVFGSHDSFNGYVFCLGDYVCWSAPVNDLGNWRYEGVIYPKTADPLNKDGKMCLYAPDVTVGPDGRYYLYYVLDKVPIVSVAVCDTPAGSYEFYGYVKDKEGNLLGKRDNDEPQYAPAVLTEGNHTYLYTGFSYWGAKSRHGAMVTVLGPDMLTITEETQIIIPGYDYSKGTEFESHSYFEAPCIRKINDIYYLFYVCECLHMICYATSKYPNKDFTYGGVIISNCDLQIGSYKPADMPTAYGGNNHGSIICIQNEWYIFYQRHTNGHSYSRQGCAEHITFTPEGQIPQVELTSCGLNPGPLLGEGEYPAYIACNLFIVNASIYVSANQFPRVTQDGRDGDEACGYIANMHDSAVAGFKYFDCKGVTGFKVTTRGYIKGDIEIRTKWDGDSLGTVKIDYSNVWETYYAPISIPDGVHAIYLTFHGHGTGHLKSFEFCKD